MNGAGKFLIAGAATEPKVPYFAYFTLPYFDRRGCWMLRYLCRLIAGADSPKLVICREELLWDAPIRYIRPLEIGVGDAKCGVLTSELVNSPGFSEISWRRKDWSSYQLLSMALYWTQRVEASKCQFSSGRRKARSINLRASCLGYFCTYKILYRPYCIHYSWSTIVTIPMPQCL